MILKIWSSLFLLMFCWGCQSTPPPSIQIKPTNQGTLTITGINEAILNDIDRDSIKNWESLIAIYKMPADTDLKDYQPIQPGRYAVKNGVLSFIPDTSFVKQHLYFIRYYNYGGNKSIWDYLRGKTAKGQLHYTDLIFKP